MRTFVIYELPNGTYSMREEGVERPENVRELVDHSEAVEVDRFMANADWEADRIFKQWVLDRWNVQEGEWVPLAPAYREPREPPTWMFLGSLIILGGMAVWLLFAFSAVL